MRVDPSRQRVVQRAAALARKPGAYAALAIPLAIPLFLASSRVEVASPPVHAAGLMMPPRSAAAPKPAPRAELAEHSVILPLEAGDTLDAVLLSGGLTRAESAEVTKAFASVVDVRRLKPGALVRFHRGAAERVDAVRLKIAGWGELDAIRQGDAFQVTAREAEVREIQTTVAAQIDSSLYEAIRVTGESPQLVQQLVDVFQWDIDFFELQKGDRFSLVVRKRYAGADFIGYGPIVAATFTHSGETSEAFRHEMADGSAGYYSRSGRPLRKQFLRAPLKFTRITSGFSKRRFHPILNYFRPHHGVDYGAPTGTPVMTTADGVVVETAYRRGEGNVVRIRHSSRIETSYLHLSRFAKGVRRGTRVTQGDVIGYVGATGLATAPHLDYRVRDGGTWLDPLKLKSITPDALAGENLRRFRTRVAELVPQLTADSSSELQAAARHRALF
ncbi:MAG TPA: peptidoglycan DD-metalloendopeptidase family protein [Thermoanaerobaculia bacterium]|nr:peptidoglycan DD-metalloendopeptidase family protein [Thermoanaerobaculia bacterium]